MKDLEGRSRLLRSAFGRRRWLRWTLAFLGALLALLLLAPFLFRLWLDWRIPGEAPHIAFSLDPGWLNRLGLTRSTYDQAIARAGGRLIDFRPQDAPGVDDESLEALLRERNIAGLLLSGGGDVAPALYGGEPGEAIGVDEKRDRFEIALIQAARKERLPILGICRGCQILNVALGGSLRNLRHNEELRSHHFSLSGHPVTLVEGSRLARALGTTRLDEVYSFHGQAVDRLGEDIRVAATAGDGVIEAIEVGAATGEAWIVAVQWHPEMAPGEPLQERLFQLLIEQARLARDRRQGNSQPSRPAEPGSDLQRQPE